jgi:hypothetical protein
MTSSYGEAAGKSIAAKNGCATERQPDEAPITRGKVRPISLRAEFEHVLFYLTSK